MRHLAAAVLACLAGAWAANSEQWAQRSIYQIVTDRFAVSDGSAPNCTIGERKYCGGTWAGIMNKLDYILGMGFDAIWISPVVENFEGLSQYGEAYHGYWTQNINHLNNHFGTAADLKALVQAVHAAGMYIMVDVTINAIAWPGPHEHIDYTRYPSPFNQKSAYHPFCWIDYTDATSVLKCWVGDDNVALMDVRTERASIRQTYQSWIRRLVTEFDLDGLRIDALKSIEADFFPGFLAAAGVFAIGENFQADPVMCCSYQSTVPGLLNYPVYWGLYYAFNGTEGGMQHLVTLMQEVKNNCTTNLLGNFIENHDLQRFASVTFDQHRRINALAFSMVNDGMPVVYYGQEQAFEGRMDPYNREALWTSGYDTSNPYYSTMATLNAVRRNAIARDPSFITSTTTIVDYGLDYLVLKKGDLLSILFNDGIWGSNESMHIDNPGYPASTTLIEVISQDTTTTDMYGGLTFKRKSGAPIIFWPSDKWDSTIPKPNTQVSIDTHTKATTTMTTEYVYPSAKPMTNASRQIKAPSSLDSWAAIVSLGLVAVTVMAIL